jgi:hypothetical protein
MPDLTVTLGLRAPSTAVIGNIAGETADEFPETPAQAV